MRKIGFAFGLAALFLGGLQGLDTSASAAAAAGGDYHLLHFRNTTPYAVEYCLAEGPVNTSTTWVGLRPGATREFYPREGQYLFVRWQGSNDNGGTGLRCPAHPHRQWWWKVTGNLNIVADYEKVPPGYDGN